MRRSEDDDAMPIMEVFCRTPTRKLPLVALVLTLQHAALNSLNQASGLNQQREYRAAPAGIAHRHLEAAGPVTGAAQASG